MTKGIALRRELLDKWRGIEDEEEDDTESDDPTKRRRLHHLKEKWFLDSYNYLVRLPEESHVWCNSWELMGPLLETFYNYHKDERADSPLRALWARLSREMRRCVQCVSQHHQALETYLTEFEASSIGPFLEVMRGLDEERVYVHLKEVNARLTNGYDPSRDNAEVVCLMYEVLMFPVLLDDQSLFTEFELFIEAVDNVHELALAGNQQFPGVYLLLFCNRRVRTVGRRLARSMEKLRRVSDLEPLQPLLNKFLAYLEMEVLPSASKTSRPRAQIDRISIWLGITSLLEFLDPPAFEEGILERYPIFFDIVLNHISGDSAEFSHAVTCLKELFKMLGCKLWLRATLSPSVMRNTLVGQCFHTRNEKIHKDIFDLFPPFLQSLEALQDGEHEKQRRQFLYFLLHQVPASSNFNLLTRKLACKIALLIILRGYKMSPPCPPFECSHMWGPTLVASLKDSSLHSSLRQPAIDLIQTIMVSDATALVTYLLNNCIPGDRSTPILLNDDDADGLSSSLTVEEKDNSCWMEFFIQSKVASQECRNWTCIPMLWIDVLVDIDLSTLPVSFFNAVFWARSRLVLVEPENSAEMAIAVRTWLSSCATEISKSFGWKVPTGSDDGGGGKESKNSIKVSLAHLSLIRTFNRLTEYFLVQIGQGELPKQWTWEPSMAESVILSLLDSNDNVRQFGKCMLEQVSNTRGLASGLKFLCSDYSLSATFSGLRHALDLVQMDSVVSKFHNLQHFFFVLCKLLKEESVDRDSVEKNSSSALNTTKYSSQGGFLIEPVVNPLPGSTGHSSNIDLQARESFRSLLSEAVWPSIKKCLVEGKAFIDYSLCQMTCVRVLEILPVAFGILCPSLLRHSGTTIKMLKEANDFIWLHDLLDWGKSSQKVVVVYWKRTVTSLLNLLRGCGGHVTASNIKAIENLVLCDSIDIEKLAEEVSRLRVSLSKEVSCTMRLLEASASKSLSSAKGHHLSTELQLVSKVDKDLHDIDSRWIRNLGHKSNFIDLSDDDDAPNQITPAKAFESGNILRDIERVPTPGKCSSQADGSVEMIPSNDSELKDVCTAGPIRNLDVKFQQRDVSSDPKLTRPKSEKLSEKAPLPLSIVSEKEKGKKDGKSHVDNSRSSESSEKSKSSVDNFANSEGERTCITAVQNKSDSILRELVRDIDEDPFEKSAKKQVNVVKFVIPAPKRQLIQLKSPVANRHGILRQESGAKRFKPPRLDDWYKPILEVNYFAMVGLTSTNEDENQTVNALKKVPVSFQTPEQYVGIFRPFVLEEFKAQLYNSFMEMSSWDDIYYGRLSVLSVERVDDFHLLRFVHDDNDATSSRSFAENDLVLLTKKAPQSASHEVHVVGKVERRERDNKRSSTILLIKFYFLNGSSRLYQARRQLVERSKWHASRIMSITPQLREFQALSSIKDIPVLSAILKPVTGSVHADRSLGVLNKLSQPLEQMLRASFNESQLQAIEVAVGLPKLEKSFELSLIQGPPGTGKTRTVLAIVSGLLAILRGASESNNSERLPKQSNCSINSRPKISQSVAIARAWQDAALAKQLDDDNERNEKTTESSARRRVLICAQSNAAVDELVSRISSEGLYGSDGKKYKPYLVRVGNAKTVHPNSLPFFIDTIVDHHLTEERMCKSDANASSNTSSSTALRSNLEKLADRIRFYEAKRANLDCISERKTSAEDAMLKGDDAEEMSDVQLECKLRKLYEQKKQIYKDLSAAQARERRAGEEIKTQRHRLRKSILKEAEIVVTTLSGCGGDLYTVCSESMAIHKFGTLSENTLFDAVIIDEAAQALEPATLIPLQLLKSTAAKCVMVGDPKQLPATVLSNVASKFLYECSMFERLQRAGHSVVMLTKQYRMHPEICRFPSLHFYDGKLLNGEQMFRKSASFHESRSLGPYVFYDIMDGKELRDKNTGAMSLYNEHEAEAAVELLRFFKMRYPSEFIGGRIGVITPYKCQLSLLRSQFSSAFGSSAAADMEFNTVDGFQGREVDILILSTVRAVDSGSDTSPFNPRSIGFVADVRRMNVALTRAKLSLWILGCAATLRTNQDWAALLKDAGERNLIISGKRPYRSFFKAAASEYCDIESSVQNPPHERRDYIRSSTEPGKRKDRKARSALKERLRHNTFANNGSKVTSGTSHLSVIEEDLLPKEKVKDVNDLPEKMGSLSVNSSDNKSKSSDSEGRKFITHGHSKSKESAGKSDFGRKSHGDKKEEKQRITMMDWDHSDQQIGDSHKNLKVNKSTGQKKSSKRVSCSSAMEVSTSADRALEGMDAHNDMNACHKGGSVDIAAKRKQQREAVDAILYTSLISTKGPDTSKKSMAAGKRPRSPTSSAHGGNKLPKASKCPSLKRSLSENQTHQSEKKKS